MDGPHIQAKCPRCGEGNRREARFCGGCGAPLSETKTCRECGAATVPHQRFCDECGVALGPSPAADESTPPLPRMPETFAGERYRTIRFLGEGGRKRVYLAQDTRLGRQVAISAFKSEGLEDAALSRARREAEAMGKLGDHPDIVTIYDIGEERGTLFLVSQFMSGGDLAGLLAQAEDGRLGIEAALRIAGEICAGLEHAHAAGIVHRDIKPQNVWLTPDGTAKIGDFGLAMAADRSRITAEGTMVGTVAYMSPEQGLGRPADARSDLYSLGIVVYEMTCGTPPFIGEEAAAVISQHVSTVPVTPGWHRSDVPKALEQLILRLLAKSPDERPQTAVEVRESLESLQAALSVGAPAVPETTKALSRLSEGFFLGRERELEELRTAVDEGVGGRGHLQLISGEAGVGKTRLATEVDSYADLRGAQVLRGRCYEGEGVPPFWPWVQAMRGYVQTRDPEALRSELGSGASDIAQIVSEVRQRLPDVPESQPLDPEQARFRLFDSITTFLLNASSVQPLAIFLEDLHLADRPSLMLLQFIGRELSSAPIFVLCTYRDGEGADREALEKVLASLTRERGYGHTRLGNLSKPEVKALLEEMSQQTFQNSEELALVDAVYTESGGNPFFIEEIVRHLIESETIYRRDGKWVSDATKISDLGIPGGVRAAIEGRLERLSKRCRDLLSVASAIGQEFSLEPLDRLTGMPAASVAEHLNEAIDAAIVAPVSDQPNRYRFVHVVTRDALYQDLSAARKTALHREIGEALEAIYDERIEAHLGELAHHFAMAASSGVADKAADYSWWAGERAAAVSAHEEAVEHYQRALDLFGALSEEPVRRCELLIALGDARRRSGDAEGAKRSFLEAAELAEESSLPDQYARATLGYGGGPGGFSVRDRADRELVELLGIALQLLPERDSALRARLMARLAVEFSYSDRAEADALSRAAVEMAARVGDARIALLAMYSRQWSALGPDVQREDLAEDDEIIRLARLLGDREMEFEGHHLRLATLLQLGDIGGIDREIRACEKLAHDLRQPYYEWQAAVFRVMRALMQGRFEEAKGLAQTAFTTGQRSDPDLATVIFAAHTFFVGLAEGTLADLVEGAEELATRYSQSAWPAAFTFLLAEAGELEQARKGFDALASDGFRSIRRDDHWLTAIDFLTVTCNHLGDAAAAEVLYEMLAPYADRFTPILAGAATMGSNHAFLGHAAETAGRLDAAIEHYDCTLRINRAVGAEFGSARVCYRLACTLLARSRQGDRERAGEIVLKGIESARRLGLAGEAEQLLSLKLELEGRAEVSVQTSIDAVAQSVEETRPDIRRAAAPDGTVTVMFSDIEDSTVLTEGLGDRRWLKLLKHHNDIVRSELAKHEGYEVKAQGDGFMLAFASARRAIACAIGIQRALKADRPLVANRPLRVRMGLHTGEVLRDDEDFFGKNVVLAARIASRASGGEILVSALLRELVASTGDFDFDDEREVDFKGLREPYRVSSVRW